MIDVLTAHAGALGVFVAALLLVVILTAWWESIALSLQSAWHSLPFIGGIAWLARRQRRPSAERKYSDTTAVLALCGSYARFIRVLSRADYDNYMNYLRKAGDLGRRPFPPLLRIVFFCMVLVEAAVLAYVLAGWTLPGASEFAQQVAAFGIGFLIAVILVFFTHWAGLEIYLANQYRRDRKEWIAGGRVGPLFGPDLSLNDTQNVDDLEPAFRQRATRGHGNMTYTLSAITVVMVIAVGIGAAFVRGQVIEQELVLESSLRAKTVQRFDLDSPTATRGGGSAATEQPLFQQELSIKRRGGWATLIILSIIFFFLQLLGIFFGYRYSFNGRLSKDAYRALKADRFSSYSELLQYYDRVADIAQSKVERLQQLIEQKHGDGFGDSAHWRQYSFRDYLQTRESQRRDKPLGGDPDTSWLGVGAVSSLVSASEPTPTRTPAPLPSRSKNLSANARSTSDAAQASAPPAPSSLPQQDETLVRNSLDATADAISSAKTKLEAAEDLERKRAAERYERNRAAAKRKGSAKLAPEAE
jgi:hypothetical protein